MSKLQIRNLSKYFGETKILDDINLSVNENEFVVLVGPSGSGKSTVLRIIAGLDTPTTGEILINNKVINNYLPKERDIAMVFQNYALYPHMTVQENLAFPLKMAKTAKNLISTQVQETALLLGINNHLSKKPKQLSGGERQRVALGRAIIRKPQLFLMDEPLSNLDAKLRTQMRTELLRLHKDLSSTVIYVTHDQIEALTMGDRIIVINEGSIQQIDSPHNVYHKPANIFVGNFIGNPGMNYINFKLIDSSSLVFSDKMYNFNIPEYIFNHFKNHKLLNQEVVLGIRPEYLKLSSSNDLHINAVVDLIEMLGSEYIVYASMTDSGNKKIKIAIKTLESSKFKQNERVTFSIDFEKALFFNKDSGRLIDFGNL